MQVQFDKLQALGNELAENANIGGRETLRQELFNLKVMWEPLKDNVFDRYTMSTLPQQLVDEITCL